MAAQQHPGQYPPGAVSTGPVPARVSTRRPASTPQGAYPQGQVPQQPVQQAHHHPQSGPVPPPPGNARMDELQTGGSRTVFEFTGTHAKPEAGGRTFVGSPRQHARPVA